MSSPDLAMVLEHMQVPEECGRDDVYVLGCLDRRVTIYSQQVRALNLAAALFDQARLKVGGEVLVIGAGAAGLTCAAGLHHLGAQVQVIERKDDILPVFSGRPNRWVHPRIYDWPIPQSRQDDAHLPLMNWRAGTVENVAAQLRAAWEDTGLVPMMGVRDVSFDRNGITWNPVGDSAAKIIVLAVGFGLEPEQTDGERRYWEQDGLDGTRIDGPARTWLISGCGDGALTDLFRLRIRDFRHEQMVAQFTDNPETESLVRRIEAIERDLEMQRDPSKLHAAYKSLRAPGLDSRYELRGDTKVTLNAPSSMFLTASASPLNRFIAAQLYGRSSFDFLPGRLDEVRRKSKDDEKFEVRIAGKWKEFDHIVRRHGPVSLLQADFPLVWTVLEEQRKRRQNSPATMDHSRRPHWPEGYFGSHPTSRPQRASAPALETRVPVQSQTEIVAALDRYVSDLQSLDQTKSTTKARAKELRETLERELPKLLGACAIFGNDESGFETTSARNPITVEPREAFRRGREMVVRSPRGLGDPEPHYYLPLDEHPEAGMDLDEESLAISSDVFRIDPQHAKRLEHISRHARDRKIVPPHSKKFGLAERLQNIADRLAQQPIFYTLVFDTNEAIIDVLRQRFPGLLMFLSQEDPEWIEVESKLAAKLSHFYGIYYTINPEGR